MQEASICSSAEWLKRHAEARSRSGAVLYAMYSSWAAGIVTDPALMWLPVDDHLAHRGDGVFETLKCVDGALYNVDAHLDRLTVSAMGIGLSLPLEKADLRQRMIDTVRAGGHPDALVRVLVGRGPGSMGVHPSDCPAPQCYIVVAPLAPPFMASNPGGARIGFSAIPPKPPPFAAIKHCNYLPNALMAKEASDRDLDFVIGIGTDTTITEGPTENIAVISSAGDLRTPDTPAILPGTTLDRVLQLAAPLQAEGLLRRIEHAPVTRDEVCTAAEALIMGTSHDIAAVRQVEETVLRGPQGPVYQRLSALLATDIRSNPAMRTLVFAS